MGGADFKVLLDCHLEPGPRYFYAAKNKYCNESVLFEYSEILGIPSI